MRVVLRSVPQEPFIAVVLIWISLFSALVVSAQESTFAPISIGENLTGEVSAAQPSPSYSITVASPQAVQVQIFSITEGFAPSFQVFDPSGVVIQSAANPTSETAVQAMPLLTSAGEYHITVQSANGQVGQFLISVQAGPALQPPQPLSVGQTLNGNVSSETPFQMYSFMGSETEVLLLTVYSDAPTSGPIVLLTDADSGETLALNSARVSGARYRIPSGLVNYLVQVTTSGASTAETYVVCLENENGPFTCPALAQTAVVPTLAVPVATQVALPPLPSTGPCVVASASGGSINVRSGPGTNFSVVTQLTGSTTAPVTGRLPDNSWYQVNVSGIVGWVSATVVRVGGECGGVPPITLSPTITAPTPTGTQATATPTVTGTQATATPTATSAPGGGVGQGNTIPLTLVVAPIDIVPQAQLDYTASPNYGEANLSAGFTPDPYSVGMTSGGNVDVSYLGGGCSGFATTSPDFRVNYSGGGSSLLRIYFVGGGDSTIVVNDPYGNFYCVDDSFGTVNPTIDFNNPAGGAYDIWIGSYTSGTVVSGTLYLTESSGNHP